MYNNGGYFTINIYCKGVFFVIFLFHNKYINWIFNWWGLHTPTLSVKPGNAIETKANLQLHLGIIKVKFLLRLLSNVLEKRQANSTKNEITCPPCRSNEWQRAQTRPGCVALRHRVALRQAGAPVSWRRRWRLLDRGSISASGAMSLASPAWANVCREKWSLSTTSPRCWLWVSFAGGCGRMGPACLAGRAWRVTENMSNSDPRRRNWWELSCISLSLWNIYTRERVVHSYSASWLRRGCCGSLRGFMLANRKCMCFESTHCIGKAQPGNAAQYGIMAVCSHQAHTAAT